MTDELTKAIHAHIHAEYEWSKRFAKMERALDKVRSKVADIRVANSRQADKRELINSLLDQIDFEL